MCYVLIISVIGRLRQEDFHEFKAIVGDRVRAVSACSTEQNGSIKSLWGISRKNTKI